MMQPPLVRLMLQRCLPEMTFHVLLRQCMKLSILTILSSLTILNTRAQSQKQIHVCAIDALEQAGIPGARVEITSEAGVFSKLTDSSGCAPFDAEVAIGDREQPDRIGSFTLMAPFPNPTRRYARLRVLADNAEPCEFTLYDVAGRALYVSHQWYRINGGFEIQADLSGLADGMYLYRIHDQSQSEHGMIVKSSNAQDGGDAAGPLEAVLTWSEEGDVIAPANDGARDLRIEVSHEEFARNTEERSASLGEVIAVSMLRSIDQRIPLNDLRGGAYLGEYPGGLYPGGVNVMPVQHTEAGLALANSVQPLDVNGRPDPDGKIVFTSIGMSTTSSIFCGVADPSDPCKQGTLMTVIQEDSDMNHDHLVLIDGADPGKVAEEWESPGAKTFERIEREELTPLGLSELQVQVAWVNLASSQPTHSLPDPNADALVLERQYGNVMRSIKERYPNIKLLFFSSRVYGGYAISDINPEPYAYETGFAVKWLLEAQLNQMYQEGNPVDLETGDLNYDTAAPWIAWGPYVWADGSTPRSDGLIWMPEDLKADGIHLARLGVEKYSSILMEFLKTSRFTKCWSLREGVCE